MSAAKAVLNIGRRNAAFCSFFPNSGISRLMGGKNGANHAASRHPPRCNLGRLKNGLPSILLRSGQECPLSIPTPPRAKKERGLASPLSQRLGSLVRSQNEFGRAASITQPHLPSPSSSFKLLMHSIVYFDVKVIVRSSTMITHFDSRATNARNLRAVISRPSLSNETFC